MWCPDTPIPGKAGTIFSLSAILPPLSVWLAVLPKARDLKGGHENIIAVIGDGSLSGGEAYEGLSNAGENGNQPYYSG